MDERLVVHMDVNETLILGDEAGGDTWEESLNKIIAKQAVVRGCEEGDAAALGELSITWSDGSLFGGDAVPPLCFDFEVPAGTARMYRVEALKKAYAKRFTSDDSPGRAYRATKEAVEVALRSDDPDPRLAKGGHHVVIPAAWRLLEVLKERRATLVIRTFGSELSVVSDALEAKGTSLPEANIYKLRRRDDDMQFVSQASGDALDEGGMLRRLEESSSSFEIFAIHDDYQSWKAKAYDPRFGKPVWVGAVRARHVFFDDNIHNDPNDSIVNARLRSPDGSFRSIQGADVVKLEHYAIVRVPTVAAILDESWFVDHLAACEANVASLARGDHDFSDEDLTLANLHWVTRRLCTPQSTSKQK